MARRGLALQFVPLAQRREKFNGLTPSEHTFRADLSSEALRGGRFVVPLLCLDS